MLCSLPIQHHNNVEQKNLNIDLVQHGTKMNKTTNEQQKDQVNGKVHNCDKNDWMKWKTL